MGRHLISAIVPIPEETAEPVHKHEWKPCHTPPDFPRSWFQCADSSCGVFGYRRNQHLISPYRCNVKGCKRPAIDRLSGRGPRACVLWRCRECLDDGL